MPTSAEAQMHDTNPAVESVASTAAPEHREVLKVKTPKKPRQESSTKMKKRIEMLENKIERLTQQNKKLKEDYKVLKSSCSRVHRIPRNM